MGMMLNSRKRLQVPETHWVPPLTGLHRLPEAILARQQKPLQNWLAAQFALLWHVTAPALHSRWKKIRSSLPAIIIVHNSAH